MDPNNEIQEATHMHDMLKEHAIHQNPFHLPSQNYYRKMSLYMNSLVFFLAVPSL